ncbi:MAG: 30S ribosomal protein S3 [Planctomycetota bacterium]|nr:30S ribosomal protein S3 [Planctomycetota bacterium]MCX8040833.1 30S ribosomal protein S3 [Planctomycetota bacterium]MDW8372284.1 30S ribosomal protein S3 [Planctomycetota bacterium]
MGHKIHPLGFRIGITEPHRSVWFAKGRKYAQLVLQDAQIRDYLKRKFASAAIEKILIERKADRMTVTLHAGRPGVIIGKRGAEVDALTKSLEKLAGQAVKVQINEVRKPEISAQLVAENVAEQLERRGSFRRAMKRAVENAMREGARGILIKVGGRLGGAEIARTERDHAGSVPMNSLNTCIDYGYAMARTTAGAIGVRVWINHGPYAQLQEKEA